MGPNVLLAIQMATQGMQLVQQIQVMLQASAQRGTDLTDDELDTLKSGYTGVKNNVDKWLTDHTNRKANEMAAEPVGDQPSNVEG